MESTIRNVLTELVGEEAGAAGKQDDLRPLGLDSVAFIKVVVALEEATGKEVDDAYLLLDAMNTIEKMEAAPAMNTAEILQKARSKVWYQHLIPVLNAQKDLSYAVIKGEALSVQAFGAPGRRSSADIDLLVDKSQLKKLEQVLTEHGFTTARLSRAQQIVARAFSHPGGAVSQSASPWRS